MSRWACFLGLVLFAISLAGCSGGLFGDIPNCEDANIVPEWDHSAETRVITLSYGGGLEAPVSAYNNIPRAVVWGDGRIVWRTQGPNGERLAWQGQLSEPEMAAILQTFVDRRFFCMDAHYAPEEEIFDGSSTFLTVHLLDKRYSVSEYVSGAPPEFDELSGLVASGAGTAAEIYEPTLGFMKVVPQSRPPEAGLPIWDKSTGLNLADAGEGVWLEGAALAQAWEIVNQKYWRPHVVQGSQVYELYLQIPDLTGREPETP